MLKAEQLAFAQEQRVLTDVRLEYYEVLIAQRRLEVAQRLVAIADEASQTAVALCKSRSMTAWACWRWDFYGVADQHCLRFHEKGGKVREIPVRHDLLAFLNAYLDLGGLRYSESSSPLFRAAVRRTKRLTQSTA
jgi:hypothetical protein